MRSELSFRALPRFEAPIRRLYGARHFTLHDLSVRAGEIVGYGIADAPMTHSADFGNDAARTFGWLGVALTRD